ncbi:MAG: hypothetical protein ACT4OY_04295 [Alphaproteobacteria bacterium]
MFRLVSFSLFMFFCSIGASYAQESVTMRAGEHAGYSRLVFDWQDKVAYSVNTAQPGKLIITFQKNALLDKKTLAGQIAKNVQSVETLSQDPLTIDITLPAGSKTRNFQAGKRVLIDIYDAPGAPAMQSKTEIKPEAKPEPKKPGPVKEIARVQPAAGEKKAEEKPPEAVKVEEKKEKVTVVEKFGPPMPALPFRKKGLTPEVVKIEAPDTKELARPRPVQSLPEKPVKKSMPQTVQAAPPEIGPKKAIKKLEAPTIISFSAIDSIDLAVFERGRKIWMLSHLQNLMLRPQVTGPGADSLLPLNVKESGDVKIFQFIQPQGAQLRAQGGGVLWRIMMATATDVLPKEKTQPVEPTLQMAEGGGKILWPLREMGRIADITDPVTGKALKVVTVRSGEQFAGPARDFVEFEVLPSTLGIAILPKVDDLQITLTPQGVEITRATGLHFTPGEEVAAIVKDREKTKRRPKIDPNVRRIFDFNEWQMGSLVTLEQNKTILLGNLPKRPDNQKTGGIITLAKMYLSHGMWAEALGFLSFAEAEAPELLQNPEFIALRGAAQILGLESEAGFSSLSMDELQIFPEIDYWRAIALAHLGDWQQAGETMPRDFGILADYPPEMITRLSLVMSEIALRAGDRKAGAELLGLIQDEAAEFSPQQKAAFDYLQGELARQNGKPEETKKLWEPLANGPDEQYRVKAGLAMTRLLSDEKKITPKEAIDRLERLRYAWRGNELEAQVNYWLGHMYFVNGDYIKGLKIMRDAAGYAAGTDLGETITTEMAQVFSDLFLSVKLDKVSAVDAAVIHSEFSELIPPGEKGDIVASRLIDHLIKYDLFEQAETLLQGQFDRRLQGLDAYEGGVRLAAIYLLDRKPVNALSVLNKSVDHLRKLPVAEQTPMRLRQVALLRARAFSEQNKPEQAMGLLGELDDGADVNRLRADIAWRAGYWDDASEALGYVVNDENISVTAAPSAETVSLLLRYAVALNLGNDRIRLANLREKYGAAMAQTDKARVFEMVTRSWQSALLEDREALMSMVSEVDLFENFLNNSGNGATQPAAKTN